MNPEPFPPPSLTRRHWVELLIRIIRPPLEALAAGRLRERMPLEAAPGEQVPPSRGTHFEAFARSMAGLAPWLELNEADHPEEASLREHFRKIAVEAILQSLDPASPDGMDFVNLESCGGQGLVDSAFLAHAMLRAPEALFYSLPNDARERLLEALRSTRAVLPSFNNWLLFSAIVEAALLRFTGEADRMRIDYAIRQHEQWYKGDGVYGDGPEFHWDYYNSFVIQPMLLDLLDVAGDKADAWSSLAPVMHRRAVRLTAVLERFIAPDGSFPVLGRSMAYRCGAFQLLAQMALRGELPEGLSPGQVRCALDAVICRTMDAPGTFDDAGWLKIGLCGAQPGIAEGYISTGSLYLCTTAFLPLGLPPRAPFWTDPGEAWTSLRAWNGEGLTTDKALLCDAQLSPARPAKVH